MDIPVPEAVPMPGALPGMMPGSAPRSRIWTVALVVAFLLGLGWLLLPGTYVVLPVGTSDHVLARTVLLQLLRPFQVDWAYGLDVVYDLGPLVLVLLAIAHWWRKVPVVRIACGVYTILLSVMFAFHPARRLMDMMIMGVVGLWAIVLLIALRSKASPGSALVALFALQLGTIEWSVGLGPYRGLPFWCLMACLTIVFVYGILHYTRKLRHKILGRFTTIRRRPPPAVLQRRTLEGDQWKV